MNILWDIINVGCAQYFVVHCTVKKLQNGKVGDMKAIFKMLKYRYNACDGFGRCKSFLDGKLPFQR